MPIADDIPTFRRTHMFANIPLELTYFQQWVSWKYELRTGTKPTKVPLNPENGNFARVTDPTSWGTFQQAVFAFEVGSADGIGFVLTKGDPYCIIDLDDAGGDQSIMERHRFIVQQFNSYTERSPSGKGYHITIRASIPQGRRREKVEIYSDARFMTFTGDVITNVEEVA